MNDRFKTSSAKRNLARLVSWAGVRALALLLGWAAVAHGQEAGSWHVLIEPKFMAPPVSQPIAGAQKTVLVAGYEEADGALSYFSKERFAALKVTWAEFAAQAAKNVKERRLKTELVRGGKDVVQMAKLTSQSPLAATAVLAPEFAKKFADVFGDRLLVVVPNRYTILVFPRLASTYQDYAPMVRDAFRATPFPVSMEVFELGENGLRAIGSYPDP